MGNQQELLVSHLDWAIRTTYFPAHVIWKTDLGLAEWLARLHFVAAFV